MSAKRSYLRVSDFESMQNPKRPKRPTWIKSYVRELDDPAYLDLTLTVRGFLADLIRLAAMMENRIPDDSQFIGRKLNVPPRVVTKALNTCVTHGLVTRFDEDVKTSKNNTLRQKIATPSIPPSSSSSASPPIGSSTYSPGVNWQDIDEADIPF